MTEYRYWKWTNNKVGDNILKSQRQQKKEEIEDVVEEAEKKELPQLVAINTVHNEPSDKRSICNERMSSRYMVIQTPINPFLNSSNYIQDLEVQDTMLRPKDSNTSKETSSK